VAALSGHELLIGSFGASAVLLYGTPDSPLAQPRNVLGGHILSALVGCVMARFVGFGPLALAGAVGLAIVAMYLTHTTHPPGGATALIAVHDHAKWMFLLLPVAAGAVILVVIDIAAHGQAMRVPLDARDVPTGRYSLCLLLRTIFLVRPSSDSY
jgi:CBS-domain-containing membrane protein